MPYVTKQYQAVLQCVQSRGADAFTAAELTEDLRHTGHPVGLATVYRQLEKLEASSFFVNIVGGAFTACGCYLAVKAGFALSQDKMIIGMLMNLVPGIALTNAMREFIAADLISGMIKFAEAVVTAIGIAIGVVVSLAIFTPFLAVLLL